MVASIRNIANKFLFPSTLSPSTTSNSQASALPTVSSLNHTGMNSSKEQTPANNFKVRGSTSTSALSREPSMASSGWSTSYHDRMNDQMDCDLEFGDKFPELSYETKQEKAFHFNRALETTGNMRPQDGSNEATHLNPERVLNMNQNNQSPHVEVPQDDNNDAINIQLPYDSNTPTEPDLWNSNFHPIFLHRSIEQIASDSKSIKDSLNFMARYIKNKKVKASKANNLSDFDSMGDSIWNFISSIYNSNWDILYTDNKSNTLRSKILSKFTLRILSPNNRSNKYPNLS